MNTKGRSLVAPLEAKKFSQQTNQTSRFLLTFLSQSPSVFTPAPTMGNSKSNKVQQQQEGVPDEKMQATYDFEVAKLKKEKNAHLDEIEASLRQKFEEHKSGGTGYSDEEFLKQFAAIITEEGGEGMAGVSGAVNQVNIQYIGNGFNILLCTSPSNIRTGAANVDFSTVTFIALFCVLQCAL